MIRRIAAALALTAALFASTAVTPLAASAVDSCGDYTFDFDADAFKDKRVLLVLHGWTGQSQDDTTAMLQERLSADEWIVAPFAFESSNADWPKPGASAVTCLRQVISQYGASTGLAEPSVYLVGHSMGGILSRVALDRDDRNQYGQLVAGVITVDTPHKGSPWGSSLLAELVQGVRGTSSGGSSAAKCLALHHPGALPAGCAQPPAISPDIPVHQVAGVVTLTRQLLMIARDEVDTDSDGIVWLGSQAGYSTSVDAPSPVTSQSSSSVVRCDLGYAAALGLTGTATGALVKPGTQLTRALKAAIAANDWLDGTVATAIQSGTPSFLRHDAAIAVLYGAARASCGHMRIMADTSAMNMVAAKLLEWTDDSSKKSFVGTWTGPINQPGSRDYTTELTITQNPDGAYTGAVRYPELGNCAGYLSDITVSGDWMTATENITTTPGRCVQTVSLELILDGDTLRYTIPTGSGAGTTGTLTQMQPNGVELPAGAQWLYELSTGGTNTSGNQDTASLTTNVGTALYANSTNQWVSCKPQDAQGTYDLSGTRTQLSLGLALQTHAPQGMTAQFRIEGDGRTLWSGSITRGSELERLNLDVTGISTLTVLARTGDACSVEDKGYGALVQAYAL